MQSEPIITPKREAIISVRNLRHKYAEGDGEKEVLHGVNLDLYRGEIVIIMGPSLNLPCRRAILSLTDNP